MAIFRCKMCGGDLEVVEGESSCTCEFCGIQQTIPTVKDEGLQILFNRANVLRMKSEFDKAAEVYERILQQNDAEAEAYWGLILCKYGIEYVEDPETLKRIPTCHRASYDAVVSDEDYRNAIEHADVVQRGIYEQQAAEIDAIQKRIIALAQKEDPYDIFICYKETDENGKRTQDSVIANDIYYQLTREGFKVFYSAITLEDKLGAEYEPYIFSALTTSKVMLALGTKPEYFNAVWVKNEWSRFLKIMKKDRSKLLIPCYRDMDPYELPEEFAHLQAQDMGKIGFINDIVRGIKKVIEKETEKPKVQEAAVVPQNTGGTTANTQVKRGNMALEDHDWSKADGFFEEALNLDPECAEAYLGKLLMKEGKQDFASWIAMQKNKYSTANTERLDACPEDVAHINKMCNKYALAGYLEEETIRAEYEFDRGYDSGLSSRKRQKAQQQKELSAERLLSRAKQYAAGATKKQIEDGLADIESVLDQRIASAREKDSQSVSRVKAAYKAHLARADKKAAALNEDAQNRREQRYQSAVNSMEKAGDIPAYEKARDAFKAMHGYKDSEDLVAACQKEIDRLQEEKRQESAKSAKKIKKIAAIVAAVAVVCIAAFLVVTKVVIPNNNYNAAVALMDSGDYIAAYEALGELDGYKDSAELQESIESDYYKASFSTVDVGDSISFGAYEQDNDTTNGKEDIEWIVLAREDNRILVISKYALDCKPYNEPYYKDTVWESCSLREWLNGAFLNDAFTSGESSIIEMTAVTADNNPDYDRDPGSDTEDQVFLLSIAEAEKYFDSGEASMCVPSAYAVAQSAVSDDDFTIDGEGTCSWWLRTPGESMSLAAYENVAGRLRSGSIENFAYETDYEGVCVRPAVWINLES